jgi:diguanylate cyclase (GGDEF)-like protein/PAS domain S-box-containing protein
MSDKPPISDQRTFDRREDDRASRYLAGIVASSDHAIIGQSLDGTIIAWNAAAERLYGYSADEAVGRNVSIVVPPDGRDESSDLLERIRRGERVQHHRAERVRKDGTIILVSLSISPVHDANGKVVGAATIARDVTEQQRAEDQMQASSRYARSLFEVNINPLVTMDPKGKITDVNKATEEATGIPRGRLIGTDFADHFTEPDKARASYQRVLAEGIVRDYTLVLRHVSGSLMDVEYNATVHRDEAGELLGVFAAARDVTESKQAQVQIARLAAIVTSSHDAISTKDVDGVVTTWNTAAEALYGYSAEEMIGRDVGVLMPPGREGEPRELSERVRHGGQVTRFETQRKRKDSTLVDVELTMSPVHDSAGEIVVVSVIGHDITERKKAEDHERAASRYARSLIEVSLDPLVTISPEGKITDVNEATVQVTGVPREGLIGTDFSDYFTEPETARAGYREVLKTGQVRDYSLTLRHVSGSVTDVEYNATVYRSEAGELQGVFATARDVTESRALEDELRVLSLRDDMTGLYNRRGFALLAEHRLKESRRSGSTLTIVYADLDHLKSINDTHGHSAGDLALGLCSRALEATFRESDVVARIGGDEFVVVAEADTRGLGAVTMRLEQELVRRTAESGLPFAVSLTIGSVNSEPPHAHSIDDMLRQADEFMYELKHPAPPQAE